MINIRTISKEQAWQLRHQVMYPSFPFDVIKLKDDEAGLHLGLVENEKLISIISLFEDDRAIQFRKFATLNTYQGKGYGSKLLNYVIDHSYKNGASRLWCNARITAADFYRKFGFKETGTRFSKDGIEFLIMELVL